MLVIFLQFRLGGLRLPWEQSGLLGKAPNQFLSSFDLHIPNVSATSTFFIIGKGSTSTQVTTVDPSNLATPFLPYKYMLCPPKIREICWHTFSGEVDLITFTFVKTCSLLRACFRFQCLVLHSVNKCLYWISNLVEQTGGNINGTAQSNQYNNRQSWTLFLFTIHFLQKKHRKLKEPLPTALVT